MSRDFSEIREALPNHANVLGHRAFLALRDLEFHALIFRQFVAEPCAGNLVGVNKYVIVAAVNVDEPIPFAWIEPLHSTL